MRSNVLAIFTLIFTFSSCAVKDISISVQKPSQLSLPSDVQKIVVVNNSTLQGKKQASIIESILTGEQIQGDRFASDNCTGGLVNTLNESNKYQAVGLKEKAVYAEDLSINWREVKNICSDENAEMMIVMNLFDTDAQAGGMITSLATGGTPVYGEAIFDLFYPKEELYYHNMRIVDGVYVQSNLSLDPLLILNDMSRKRDVTNNLGYKVGATAAHKMIPHWVWVDRKYYQKGSKSLKKSKNLIRNGNWDLAEKKLLLLIDSKSNKEAERALFNLALVKEGQGDLNAAILYAEKAVLDYDNKLAPVYLNQLKQRQNDSQILEYQLQGN